MKMEVKTCAGRTVEECVDELNGRIDDHETWTFNDIVSMQWRKLDPPERFNTPDGKVDYFTEELLIFFRVNE